MPDNVSPAPGRSALLTSEDVMMIAMPLGIRALGMDPTIGAAWIGGTVDATGAVVAAGAMLGEEAGQVAAVVKMVQNILIGVVAFLVAVYWVTRIDTAGGSTRPAAAEIWTRFPKFILGFVGASLLFSFVLTPALGDEAVAGIIDLTSDFRGWLFCLAFVSIGSVSPSSASGSSPTSAPLPARWPGAGRYSGTSWARPSTWC